MNVTAKTFEALKTVFVELLYTEKLHGESFTPSERTQRQHQQNLHRKNYAENEFGEWTIDEETGEQGYIGDERSCFWKWEKELEDYSLVKKMHTILNGGHKKFVLGGPKVREAGKVFRKVKTASPKVVFALTNQKRVQAAIKTCIKADARIKNERARKVLFLNLDFQPHEHPVKKGMAML